MFYESEYLGVLNIPDEGYLMHHGIKGQKWYRRRFQNEDGTLTAAGKARYGEGTSLDDGRSGGNSKNGTSKADGGKSQDGKGKGKSKHDAAYYEKRAARYKYALMVAGGVAASAVIAHQVSKHTTKVRDLHLKDSIDRINAEAARDRLNSSKELEKEILRGEKVSYSTYAYNRRQSNRNFKLTDLELQRQRNFDNYSDNAERYRNIVRNAGTFGAITGGAYAYNKLRAKSKKKKENRR